MMTLGHVTDTPEAVINLTILGPHGGQLELQAVIDSGFTDFLTLPPVVISRLNLPFVDTTECQLADGRIVAMRSFLASIKWHNAPREILVLAADGEPLVGMSMLSGSKITMEVIPNGRVVIEKMQ